MAMYKNDKFKDPNNATAKKPTPTMRIEEKKELRVLKPRILGSRSILGMRGRDWASVSKLYKTN